MSNAWQGQWLCDVPLADYTSWRVGGPARFLYKPVGLQDLIIFLKTHPFDGPLLWLGLGSNSLIRDRGFSGLVILTQGGLNQMTLVGDGLIRVEAGISCAKMARFSARAGYAGGEFWAGIPGTMGGALRMNAGCFQAETWDRVVEVETITRTGEVRKRRPQEFQISYRHVDGLEDEWFVAATCRLTPGDKETSMTMIKTLLDRRAETQPINAYNCGSVFRNPPGDYAARLIESCGLKGFSVGGAVVSQKHANFIINQAGQASAADIEQLIQRVSQTVVDQTGVQLVREVHILGGHE